MVVKPIESASRHWIHKTWCTKPVWTFATAGSRFEAEVEAVEDDERQVGFASVSNLEIGRSIGAGSGA